MVSEVVRVTQLDTPTKQAAVKVDNMALKSPVKQLVFDSLEDLDVSPKDVAETESGDLLLDETRLRFVGDVDLDEKDEPLLKESRRRFVLFPIQYHEVSETSNAFFS
jgi:ribonucleoside-diphosphate reductase subunit M2